MESAPLAGYEDKYFIYPDGSIYRIRGKWKVATFISHNGYTMVSLTDAAGKRRNRTLHSLLLETYGSKRPSPAHQVRHLNGNKSDNRLANLAWGTPLENYEDARKHGTYSHGEAHGNSKLTAEIVRDIRSSNLLSARLAEKYKVTISTICYVRNNKTWKHVQ